MPSHDFPSMNLLLRLFANYAGRVGYLDGKHNYPSLEHFREASLLETDSIGLDSPAKDEPLQITEPAALMKQR